MSREIFCAAVLMLSWPFQDGRESTTLLEDRDYTWIGFRYILSESIQKELACSSEQASRLKLLTEEWRASTPRPSKKVTEMTPTERRQWQGQRAKLHRNSDASFRPRLEALLTPEQNARLKELLVQIAVSQWGMTAAADAEIALPLKVTQEQRTKLLDIKSRWFAKDGAANPDPIARDAAKMRRDAEAEAVLTDVQRTMLNELQGRRIDATKIVGAAERAELVP